MAVNFSPSNASKQKNRVMGIVLAFIVIAVVAIISALTSVESRKTVKVCKLKQAIPANAMITEDMLEPYDMYYKEFKNYGTSKVNGTSYSNILRWSERKDVVGVSYAAYYLRQDTVLFWDSLVGERTRKNSYLYSMSGELLNIKMTTTGDFGNMVVPGDSLNIRASYKTTRYDLPSEEQYKLDAADGTNMNSTGIEVNKTEMLFSEVQILDMLNSEGNSVFDIYYDYISKSKSEQEALLKDDTFLASVKPASILLECTPEEVERYMDMQSKGATYQMTLLPRDSNSSIVDSLSDIQNALANISDAATKN